MDPGHENHENPSRFWDFRYPFGLIVFGAVAGYFLLTEYLVHGLESWPAWLLLVCCVMHFFVHPKCDGRDHSHGHDKFERHARRTPRFLPRLGASLGR